MLTSAHYFLSTYLRFLIFFLLFYVDILEAKNSKGNSSSYIKICKEAAKHDDVFNHFKSHSAYVKEQEKLSYETGAKYLEFINKYYPDLKPYFEKFHENDLYGDPVTYDYGEEAGRFSPSTLKYIKMAGDLKKNFGDLSSMNIVEIGGGYGGQCKILADCSAFASYTIIEHPDCCELTRKYINLFNIKNVQVVSSDNISQLPPSDLVIGHYTFSHLEKKEQMRYLDPVIFPALNGYIIFNLNKNSLTTDAWVAHLYHNGKKSGSLDRELPLLDSHNEVIIWKGEKTSSLSQKIAPELIPSNLTQTGCAVSYSFSGGRFGDNLVAYLHAKWISYKYGLPLLYRPFAYSNQLKLDDTTQCFDSFSFESKQIVKNEKEFASLKESTLYIVPYFPECLLEYEMHNFHWLPYYEVDWQDANFSKEVKRVLSPKGRHNTLSLPTDKMTICVHIRRGGDVDSPKARYDLPLKFPPDHYYLAQIKRIAALFPDKKLYVYLMTDDLDPGVIAQKYLTALNNSQITIDYRALGNCPQNNVMVDFYSMGQFDCLIRCQSNFSLMGALLGDYRIMITPKHAYFKDRNIIVDQVELVFNP